MVMSHNELVIPSGAPGTYEMTGLDCTIIMHPQIWKCSGHYDLFHDFMVDCRETKKRLTSEGNEVKFGVSGSIRKHNEEQ